MEATSRKMFDLQIGVNITQAPIAEEFGISQSALNRYEHNQTSVQDDVLFKYAGFFDV